MEPERATRHWTEQETEGFYRNLLERALAAVPDTGAAMVLGPMFIVRSPEENFALFEKAQTDLRGKGIAVFDQLPFVDYIMGDAPFNYKVKFEIFYKGLIQSGKITACYLLPDWDKSQGTKQEIEYCTQSGVSVFKLS